MTVLFYPVGIWMWDRHAGNRRFALPKILALTFIGYSLYIYIKPYGHTYLKITGLLFYLNMLGYLFQDTGYIAFMKNVNRKLRRLYVFSIYGIIAALWNVCVIFILLAGKAKALDSARGIAMASSGFLLLICISLVENRRLSESEKNIRIKASKPLLYIVPIIIFICALYVIILLWRLYLLMG